jgi:hypothetical protein
VSVVHVVLDVEVVRGTVVSMTVVRGAPDVVLGGTVVSMTVVGGAAVVSPAVVVTGRLVVLVAAVAPDVPARLFKPKRDTDTRKVSAAPDLRRLEEFLWGTDIVVLSLTPEAGGARVPRAAAQRARDSRDHDRKGSRGYVTP